MRINIRKKFIIVFFAAISPFIAITIFIAVYNQSVLHKGIDKVNAISDEMALFQNINMSLERLLMPANDYIITADNKYRDSFIAKSKSLDLLFAKARVLLDRLENLGLPEVKEKQDILKDMEAVARKIEEMSLKIFSIEDPVGDADAKRLMEEMDYKWGHPAIKRLSEKWHAIDIDELDGAVSEVRTAWKSTSKIIVSAFALMAAAGLYLIFLFSRLFVASILALHKGSEAIAGGDLDYRIDIRTKDELAQLGSAFNDMADSLRSTLTSLKELAQKHGRLIETAPDAIILLDSVTGMIVDANPAAHTLTGYSREELLTLSCEDLPPAEGLDRYREAFKITVEEGRSTLLDTLVLRKDGSTVPVDIACTVAESGGRQIVQAFFRDNTEKKELGRLREEYTKELEKSVAERTAELDASIKELTDSREATLKLLDDVESGKKEWEDTFDSISEPIFIHDAGMKVIRCNRAYKKCTELSYKEIIGRPYYEVFPKMDGPFELCKTAHESELDELEGENIFVPEKEKTFMNRFYILRDLDGGYHSTIHIFEDITEQKRTMEALRETKERFETLFDNATDAIFIHDMEGRFLEVNRTACERLGYTRDELLKMTPMDIDTPECAAKVPDNIKRLMEKGSLFVEGAHRRRDGGVIPIEINSRIFNYEGMPAILSIARDITERRRAQEIIRQEMEITHHLLMIAEATAATTDLNRLMEHAAGCVKSIMSCDMILFYNWDKESGVFRPGQSAGLHSRQTPFFMTETIDGKAPLVMEATEAKRPVLKKCLDGGGKNQCVFFAWIEDYDTLAVIPLIGRKGVLGLLVCVYARRNPKSTGGFTERDEKLMLGVGRQVSIALEEAWLYRETMDKTMDLSRKIETIRTMHEMDKNILSTLDSQTILDTAVNMIAKVIPCDRATIVLVNMEKNGLTYAAGFGVSFLEKGGFMPLEDTSASDVIKTGRPEYTANLGTAGDLRPVEKELAGEGFLSHIRIPIVVKDEVIGVLTVGSKRPSAFTHEDLSTLENLGAQIGVALDNSRLLHDVEDMFLSIIRTLSNAIDAKSPWTKGHSERVTEFAIDIGKELGFDEKQLKNLEIAGLLHDLGKLGTYEYILDKPEKLTDDEITIMREHPGKGAEILEPIKQLKDLIPAIKYHHEFYDGNGYPDGLIGDEIPLMARILTVADTVDAMGADRPYRKGLPTDTIFAELRRCSGTQFDTSVVDAFLKSHSKKELIL